MTALTIGLLSTMLLSPQEPARLPRHPVAALAAAIDLKSHALRQAAAAELAQRDVPLSQWLAAARALQPRPAPTDVERVDAQTLRYQTKLHIVGGDRDAEILVRLPKVAAAGVGAAADGPQPLLVVRHGAGGDGASALRTWAALADRCGLVLAAPTETYELYRQEGWPHIPDGRDGLLAAVRFVRRQHDIDEDRVFAAGVAGGGHMAWDMGLHHPDLFAGLLPCNGSPRIGNIAYENNTVFLESLVGVPLRAVQWGKREAVQEEHVERSLQVLRGFGGKLAERVEVRDEQEGLGEVGAPAKWFAQRRSRPDHVVRYPDLGADTKAPGIGRAWWAEVLRVDPNYEPVMVPMQVPGVPRRGDARTLRTAIEKQLRERHPRLEVHDRGGGRFDVEDRHVHAFRLLLTEDMCGDDGEVVVRWRGQTLKKRAEPSALVLLREFVERFDRTFLPTVEIQVP